MERRSALAGVLEPGVSGAVGSGGPGVVVSERRGLAIVRLGGRTGDGVLRAAVAEVSGAPLPSAPNTATEGKGGAVLWLAADSWLVVAPGRQAADLEATLRAMAPGCSVVDVSHGHTVLRLEGPAVRQVLAAGCPLDLHPLIFAPGSCARSHIGPVDGLLHALGDGSAIDVYVARGFAVSFWEWLEEAAAETGLAVENPENDI